MSHTVARVAVECMKDALSCIGQAQGEVPSCHEIQSVCLSMDSLLILVTEQLQKPTSLTISQVDRSLERALSTCWLDLAVNILYSWLWWGCVACCFPHQTVNIQLSFQPSLYWPDLFLKSKTWNTSCCWLCHLTAVFQCKVTSCCEAFVGLFTLSVIHEVLLTGWQCYCLFHLTLSPSFCSLFVNQRNMFLKSPCFFLVCCHVSARGCLQFWVKEWDRVRWNHGMHPCLWVRLS